MHYIESIAINHVSVVHTEPFVRHLYTGNYNISVKRTISLEKERSGEFCKLVTKKIAGSRFILSYKLQLKSANS